jgi:hypothetical protein
MNFLGFCWKRMVLGAQLMTKTTNKSRSYFQRVTVISEKKINYKGSKCRLSNLVLYNNAEFRKYTPSISHNNAN